MSQTERWEEAWADYIFALEASDATREIGGEDFVYWCGVAGRRLTEAKGALRQIDRAFCDKLGI